jgi:hypothetical protein
MSKTLSLTAEARRPCARSRLIAARALGAASALLGRLAAALSASAAPRLTREASQVLELYAEAGAPEGTLYLDGERVGFLPGVKRL